MADEKPDTSKLGLAMFFIAWCLIFFLMTLYFHGWYINKTNPNQNVQGWISPEGEREIRLKRNIYHHYVMTGAINDAKVIFILDTGATAVVVPGDLAQKINLPLGQPQLAKTANGVIRVYQTRIDTLTMGNITLQDVSASINPNMTGNEVLLGMSALKQLKLIQEDEELIIIQKGQPMSSQDVFKQWVEPLIE